MTATQQQQPIKAAFAAFMGTMIEWYDFYCYGTAAALVFGQLFFSSASPMIATLASLGTFAIGFIARPLGALFFGHIGDKIGRKRSLVLTLIIMGVSTTLIGFLPTYSHIGIVAPVLLILLRLLQGVAVGGEWGGAVLIASEHASSKWRTILSSAPQYGSPVGLILATIVFRLVSDLPQEQLMAWGWRIPFWLSGILVILAFFIRSTVNESPEHLKRQATGNIAKEMPLKTIFRSHKATLLYGIAFCLLGISGFYFITTLMITYTTTYLGIEKKDILNIIAWVGVVELISFPLASLLAHRYGERKFLLWVTALVFLWSVPMMQLIASKDVSLIATGILTATLLIGGYYAVLAAYLPRVFPVHIRYTGISLSFQLCGAIFGGTTPLIGILILNSYPGTWIPLCLMFMVISGLTFLASYMLNREPGKKLQPVNKASVSTTK